MILGAGVALLPAASCGQTREPSVCPTAASTVAIDLGMYRGAWLATNADGSILGHDGWQSCKGAPKGTERAWDGCNFSLCNLPDGNYALRFADKPSPPVITFKVHGGMLDMTATKLAMQAGNYGVDLTGSREPVAIDLQGYALDWSIAHWPGPFQGGETHGRAAHDGGKLTFSMYPGGPYAFNFGGAHAKLTVSPAGAISLAPDGPLSLRGNVAWLRVAPVLITPPGAGTWVIGGVSYQGPQTLMLPAGATFALGMENGTPQNVALDGACHLVVSDGAFRVSVPGGVDVGKTCG